MIVEWTEPVAVELVRAIRAGDLAMLHRVLRDRPAVASARLRRHNGIEHTPLHVATEWPGYFPSGPKAVRMLIIAGADPNARTSGGSGATETPLHWTASSDDVEVADVLIEGGADVGAGGGSIGTPLDNAIGYGCWNVARRLAERGARVDKLWQAAALGLMPRVRQLMAATPPPGRDDLTEAFWQACHGGQRRVAEYLLSRGADIHAAPRYAKKAAVDIAAGPDTGRRLLVTWLRDRGARSFEPVG